MRVLSAVSISRVVRGQLFQRPSEARGMVSAALRPLVANVARPRSARALALGLAACGWRLRPVGRSVGRGVAASALVVWWCGCGSEAAWEHGSVVAWEREAATGCVVVWRRRRCGRRSGDRGARTEVCVGVGAAWDWDPETVWRRGAVWDWECGSVVASR